MSALSRAALYAGRFLGTRASVSLMAAGAAATMGAATALAEASKTEQSFIMLKPDVCIERILEMRPAFYASTGRG